MAVEDLATPGHAAALMAKHAGIVIGLAILPLHVDQPDWDKMNSNAVTPTIKTITLKHRISRRVMGICALTPWRAGALG